MVQLSKFILHNFPSIKTSLRVAHSKTPPEKFVQRSVRMALYMALGITALGFFIISRGRDPATVLIILAILFSVSLLVALTFLLNSPKGQISKRRKEIDREVLFAGRYLMIKIESGAPLVNTLNDASKSYGILGKYFKEIVDDINTGVPVEEALESARTYSASDKFRRILWQIVTALKTGAEITSVLKSTLQTITAEQQIEIKRYGKKLNSLMLFYMIVACVVPSLGLTMLLIISGFLNLELTTPVLWLILLFLAFVQSAFIMMVKAARPTVEI